MARWLVATALLACAACQQILGLDDLPPPPQVCTDYALDVSFADGSCMPWGQAFASGGATVTANGDGTLVVTIAPPVASQAGCRASPMLPFAGNGIAVEVRSEALGSGDVLLRLLANNVAIGVDQNELLFTTSNGTTTFGQAPYDPVAQRWWRLRPVVVQTAMTVVAEYADGSSPTAWTMLGFQNETIQIATDAELRAGCDYDTNCGGSATFTRIIACA